MAASRVRAISLWRRSVISRRNALKTVAPPSCSGVMASSTGISVPSRRSAVSSMRRFSTGPSPVRRKCARPRSWASRWAGGTIVSDSRRPTTASAGQPKIAAACGFQLVMRPSTSIVMTASSA